MPCVCTSSPAAHDLIRKTSSPNHAVGLCLLRAQRDRAGQGGNSRSNGEIPSILSILDSLECENTVKKVNYNSLEGRNSDFNTKKTISTVLIAKYSDFIAKKKVLTVYKAKKAYKII